jgi:5''-nucleotidase/2'',3''-cyclic phosphodiesterase and related esterases
MSWWKRVFLGGAANTSSSKGEPPRMLRKLSLSTAPAVTYAVGDIHGQLELYKALEARILEDARSYDGPVLIVLLGDLIDRGPKSAQLIDYLLEPPLQGVTRLCLRGNHEDMFLQVLRHPSIARDWISWGALKPCPPMAYIQIRKGRMISAQLVGVAT